MKYQGLVESVRDEAGLDSSDAARAAVSAVVTTFARGLPPEDRGRMARALPGSLEPAVEQAPAKPDARPGTEQLTELADQLGTTPERARYLAQAVLRALRAGDPDLADLVRNRIVSDLVDVLTQAGESPRQAASVRREVPTELSDADIERELRHLTGWTGDHAGISRTVQLPRDRLTHLVDRVQREAREFNDHAHVERDADTVTFTLTTGRPGVVTVPDLRLAERIDRVVAEVGSGG